MAGRYITVKAKDGGSFKAYLATPEKGSGPGIVLLQEIFGINAYIRSVADYYAEEGYVVLAPDLFWRIEPGIELGFTDDDWKKAFAYREKFNVDKSVEDIGATIAALRALPECKGKIGALDSASAAARLSRARPGSASIAPSPITVSASRKCWAKPPRSNARWCCTSPRRTDGRRPRW